MDNLSINCEFNNCYLKLEAQGEMSYSDLLFLINVVSKNEFVQMRKLKLLLDLRRTIAKVAENEMHKLLLPFIDMVNKFEIFKLAEIVENPIETALAILFNDESKFISNLDYKLYNSPEAAIRWLLSG